MHIAVHEAVQPQVHELVQEATHNAVHEAVQPPVQSAVQPPIHLSVHPPVHAVQPDVHIVHPVQSVQASPHGTQEAPPAIAITVYAAVDSRAVPVAFRNFLLDRSSLESISSFAFPFSLIGYFFSFSIIDKPYILKIYNHL